MMSRAGDGIVVVNHCRTLAGRRWLAGGSMTAGESSALPPSAREQSWAHVLATETGPWTTNFQRLTDAGLTRRRRLPEDRREVPAHVTRGREGR